MAVDPPDGSASAPTNSRILIRLSEPIRTNTITTNAVRLLRAGIGIAGSLTVSDDRPHRCYLPKLEVLRGRWTTT